MLLSTINANYLTKWFAFSYIDFPRCFYQVSQFPFHFWLPNAMAAPTPVSAYLHSAPVKRASIFWRLSLFTAQHFGLHSKHCRRVYGHLVWIVGIKADGFKVSACLQY
ncbi:proton-conducting transporter membrane subunit [Vibrio sp.]|uniref:proton-conducting transporter transmembrane domain-containing protein n=1 Tax=Vibrio sp. TaxID=678 RepID=UPI003AA9B3D6